MRKNSNIIIAFAILLALILLPIVLLNTDWSYAWFLPLALVLLIILLLWAMIDLENCFLFLLAILPTVHHFNYLKINIFSFFPLLNEFQIYVNPAAIIYLLLILLALSTWSDNWQIARQLPLRKILIATMIFSMFSIAWSSFPQTSLVELAYLLVPFAVYLLAFIKLDSEKSLIKVIIAVILSSIIPVFAACAQILTGNYYYEQDSFLGRLNGTMDHPNTFGLYLLVVIALLIIFFLAKQSKKIKKNKLLLFYLIILSAVFILTYSRTSWLCFALFISLFAIAEKTMAIILLAGAPIALSIYAFSANIQYRVNELFSQAIFNSFTARQNIWKIAWEKITARPIVGYGVGTAEPIIDAAKDWRGGASLPHNDYLLQQLELGFIGLLMYLSYTIGLIYQTGKTYIKLLNKYSEIRIGYFALAVNFKAIAFGLLLLLIALLPATFFESLSQKIIIQIIAWASLGSLFGLTKTSRTIN